MPPEVNWEGKGIHNIGMQSVMKAGTDIDEEFDRASYVQHRDYKTHRMVHAAMEPHGAVATYRNGDLHHLDVHPDVLCGPVLVCPLLGVGENQVRGNQASCGRRFRAASWIPILWSCAAKMAEMTGRPVRMILSREEVFQTHAQPPPHYMHIDTAFGTNGKLLAKKCYHVLDGGPYGGSGVAACAQSTLWANFPYKMIPWISWQACVYQ